MKEERRSSLETATDGYPFSHTGISTRRVTRRGTVHEMADLGTGTMCGIELAEPWTYTEDRVNCVRCIRAEVKAQAKDPERR